MGTCFAVLRMRHILICAGVVLASAIAAMAGITAAPEQQRHLLGWLIAVDAGHGGNDYGAWFPKDAVVEKDITLDVAYLVGQELAGAGAAVVLIREDDSFVQLSDRAHIANRANARMFVSIHVNRYPGDTRCCGAQTFYQKGSQESQELAELVQEHLRRLDTENHRVALPADYQVLRESKMPAVLVEIGFATNSRDRRLIMDAEYRNGVAYAIKEAVLAYSRNQLPQ